jgi:hypothetical protein
LSRIIPHWLLVAGRRPIRPRVTRNTDRCRIQIVRTSHRGTFGGASWVVSTAVVTAALHVYGVNYAVNIATTP